VLDGAIAGHAVGERLVGRWLTHPSKRVDHTG
jgi:hypothetical protein